MKPCKILFLLVMVICVMFTACSSDVQPFTTPTQPALVTNITVSPATIVLERGDTRQFTATVETSGAIPKTVKWAVVGGVASTIINNNGLLTVANNETATVLTVTATSEFGHSQGASAIINLKQVTDVTVSSITGNISIGTTRQYIATVTGSNDPSQAVDWTVTGGVTGTNISNSGLLTVADNETSPSLIIRATSIYDNTKSGTTTATISIPIISSIIVNPTAVTVSRGQTQLFTAVVNGSNNPPQAVDWTVTGGVAGSIISSSGLLTVASNENSSSLTVRATSRYDNTKSGTASVSVTAIGSIGPSGGYIFYDKGSYSNGWRYLEAAPASSEFRAQWGLYSITCPGTQTGIGTGRANTTTIINLLNANNQTGRAAQLCVALNINGYTGWFLPSRDELNEMWIALKMDRNNIGGFNISGIWPQGYYWSSSDYNAYGSQYNTWSQRFNDGSQSAGNSRSDILSVRAIRAF